jgi:signal transduction histidine kinase
MLRLRIIAIIAPLAFAVTLGVFTEEALHRWFSTSAAHIMATAILTAGVIIFTFWMFGMLERMQVQIDSHRQRESKHIAEMARMAERERIGLALHDGVIQDIYGVQLTLDGCLNDQEPGELASCLSSSIDDLTLVIGKMRQYIFGLRPYLDGDHDFSRALKDLLTDAAANNGTATELKIDEEAMSRVSGLEADVLFELANQAVASAISRGATQVRASLSKDEHSIRLDMADNGRAFDYEREHSALNWAQEREPRPIITVSGTIGHNVLVACVPLSHQEDGQSCVSSGISSAARGRHSAA